MNINPTLEAGGTAAACAVVGWLLKTWPKYPNWAIPHAVVALGAATNFFATDHSLGAVILGAIIGASSTGFHQMTVQTSTKDPQ